MGRFAASWTGWPPLRVGGHAVDPTAPTDPTDPTGPVDPINLKTLGWRAALTGASVLGVDGHSLSDAGFKNQGYLQTIRNALYDPDDWGEAKVLFNTGPYATLDYRWNTDMKAVHGLAQWFRLAEDMALLDCFVNVQAGPFPRLGVSADAAFLESTLDYGLRFYDLAVKQGVTDLVWHTINAWPNGLISDWTTPKDFRSVMAGYEATTHYLVGYWEWKLKQLNPGLPSSFRIGIIPHARMWLRIDSDIAAGRVPGVTDVRQFFRETEAPDIIHPNAVGDYAAQVFSEVMLFKDNPNLFETYTSANMYEPVQPGKWPVPVAVSAIHADLAKYLFDLAVELLTAYEPAGLGGTDRGASTWYDPASGDPLPNWGGTPTDPTDPTDPAETAPQDYLLQFDGTAYSGPALTGDALTYGPDYAILDGKPRTLPLQLSSGFYAVYVFENDVFTSGTNGAVIAATPDVNGWSMPQAYNRLTAGDGTAQVHAMSQLSGAPWPEGVYLGNINQAEWNVIHAMSAGDQQGCKLNGGAFKKEANPAGVMGPTDFLRLFEQVTGKLAWMRVYAYEPTPAQIAANDALAMTKKRG